MAISLYDFTVSPFQITLGAMEGVLEKGRSFCAENDIALADVVSTRLHDDMLPFHFQIVSLWHHSLGALKGVQAGEFSPPPKMERDYAGLQELVRQARTGLDEFTRQRVEGFAGKDVVFKLGQRSMPFIAEDFLASFSLPNFHFHATTAYDILRIQGVPLGKRDYLGQLKLKADNSSQ
ncbi:MAG: DUF1993 family protein [Gammaproteobacteria bacterium]|nr:DUF1993 family protein [Gammaproteobacteria bacterium]